MAFDAGEIGFQNDGIFSEVHACLRVSIGGVIQMITRLAGKSIHRMGGFVSGERKRVVRVHFRMRARPAIFRARAHRLDVRRRRPLS